MIDRNQLRLIHEMGAIMDAAEPVETKQDARPQVSININSADNRIQVGDYVEVHIHLAGPQADPGLIQQLVAGAMDGVNGSRAESRMGK